MFEKKDVKFECVNNLKNYAESMLFDSDIGCIATLIKNNIIIELKIEGEKRVFYKDEPYRYADDYPQKLKDLFKTGKAYEDEDVKIIDNNWLCVIVYEDKEYIDDFVFEDDLSKLSKKKLRSLMLDYANYYL